MRHLQRIFIYASIIAIIFPTVGYIEHLISKQKLQAKTIPFGNVMSEYFYYVTTGLSDHNLVAKSIVDSYNIIDSELADFYTNLDWTANKDLIQDYNSNGDSTWHSINLDGTSRRNFLNYWQRIRPQMMAFYTSYLPPIEVSDPVVHFRCSDSPFIKHIQYHLTTENSVKWMAQQIKQQGYDKIIFLNCSAHRVINKNACAEYADFYSSLFNKEGITVEKQCNSILRDFSLMVHSPLLVSLNVSSYSFMAGVAKDPSRYISCNMGMEIRPGNYTLQTEADWILDPNQPLLHTEVPTYENAKEVIAKLRS